MSSQLIRQGEVVRVTTGMWTNNITLFLFDHQIVYCKKVIVNMVKIVSINVIKNIFEVKCLQDHISNLLIRDKKIIALKLLLEN